MHRVSGGAVAVYRRLFLYRTHVYVMRAKEVRLDLAEDFALRRFEREEEIPDGLFETGTRFLFHEGSTLWVATCGGELAACAWTRPADALLVWFCPLARADVLIYAAGTVPKFRRRGLMSALFNIAGRETVEGGHVAWTDCAVWNVASARMMEKAGFTRDRTVRTSEVRPPL